MAERGWTLAQVQESIEARKPDFAAYVAPQMEFSDVVISVLPSDISTEAVGKHLKVWKFDNFVFISILFGILTRTQKKDWVKMILRILLLAFSPEWNIILCTLYR